MVSQRAGVAQLDGGGPGRAPAPPDIAQEWRLDNNERDTFGQAPLGDYTGIPFNEAGRVRSDTTPESIWGTLEYQCRPHASPHQWRGLGGARILKEQDPLTRDVSVYHVQFMRSLDRPIFMDARPHPPAYAPHTWTGFSTGEWIGRTLKVTTTHLKDGFLRRGGPQTSDMYSMTEFISRHDEILTIVTVIDDPIYLDQPYIHSTTYTVAQGDSLTMETCNGSFTENGGTDRHWVPHFLPGQNTDGPDGVAHQGRPADGRRWASGGEDWVPLAAARGGVKTLYPEYRSTLDGATAIDARVASLTVPAMRSAISAVQEDRGPESTGRRGPRAAGAGQCVHARGRRHEHHRVGRPGGRCARQYGYGADVRQGPRGRQPTGSGGRGSHHHQPMRRCDLPRRVGVVQSLHRHRHQLAGFAESPPLHRQHQRGGRSTWAATRRSPRSEPDFAGGGLAGAVANVEGAPVIAHENVLNRMSAPAGKQAPFPQAAWPTVSYFDEFYKLPAYFNGEGVTVYHAPAANTDGDSIVLFRRSEVISAGDIFSTVSYPMIDVAKGGSVDGVIGGLNQILDLSFAEYRRRAAPGSFPATDGCPIPPTWPPTAIWL